MSKKKETKAPDLDNMVNHELRVLCDKLEVSKKGGRGELIERIKKAQAK